MSAGFTAVFLTTAGILAAAGAAIMFFIRPARRRGSRERPIS